MDLLTMKKKCAAGEYRSAQQFADDLALMFDNCELYNTVSGCTSVPIFFLLYFDPV